LKIESSRSVQAVITAKQDVTNWNHIVERAGRREENYNKRQRQDYRPMVSFQ
jgi:hypothetical protein